MDDFQAIERIMPAWRVGNSWRWWIEEAVGGTIVRNGAEPEEKQGGATSHRIMSFLVSIGMWRFSCGGARASLAMSHACLQEHNVAMLRQTMPGTDTKMRWKANRACGRCRGRFDCVACALSCYRCRAASGNVRAMRGSCTEDTC
jgi:hypothetical protein